MSNLNENDRFDHRQKHIMFLLEELINLLNKEKITFWIDWGTMLGYKRHGNIIPWDYDADLNMMSQDYDHLISLFAERDETIPRDTKEVGNRKYKIGRLCCLPDAYKDDGCLWIQDAAHPESFLGI